MGRFHKERIFNVLGMTTSNTNRCCFDFESQRSSSNTQQVEGKLKTITSYAVRKNVGPAGAINSSVAEMSKWLSKLSSIVDRLTKDAIVQRASEPRDVVGHHNLTPLAIRPAPVCVASEFFSLCLGWGLSEYRG
jgi:hypothetical protein